MAIVTIKIDVDEEYADDGDSTGLTERAYEEFVDAVGAFGTIMSGPDQVDS